MTGQFSRSRLAGAVVLVVAGAVTWTPPSVLALGISTALLALLAIRVTLASRQTSHSAV